MRSSPAHAVLAAAAAALGGASSCSRPAEPVWPTRNYSGVYAVEAHVSSNTCRTPVFPPGDTLRFTLIQYPDNRARMDIPPVASIPGGFRGDRLDAYVAVAGDAAGAAGDSLRYRLELEFEGKEFSGSYQVEQPPIGADLKACRQAFEVRGRETESE